MGPEPRSPTHQTQGKVQRSLSSDIMQPLAKLLTRQRTACATVGISKKRVFESVAKIISEDQLSLSYDEIFTHLIGREKLGSTGLGQGIAIPHCRIENCTQPMGTLVTLSEPVDYDSPDDQPVDLIYGYSIREPVGLKDLSHK